MPQKNNCHSHEHRRRGHILTPEGLQKMKEAIKALEDQENYSEKLFKYKLADRARISKDSVGKILGGEKRVDKNTILALANALNLELVNDIDYIQPETISTNINHIYAHSNLPISENLFIGREAELLKLLKYLSLDYRMPVIIVDGIGGVGKTALVIEAAHHCLEASGIGRTRFPAPQFEAIIFTSAKEDRLEPRGIRTIEKNQGTLREIFHAIARTLDDQSITRASLEDQREQVYNSLKNQTTLLIVDNLETIEDKDEVLDFLADLPPTTKAVVTTRERVVLNGCIRLESLPEEDSLKLLMQQAKQKDVSLNEKDAKAIYERFGGIPVALIYIIGQLASGYSLKSILNTSNPIPKHITQFCFQRLIALIRNKPAHKLLMALSVFRKAPNSEAISEVAGLNKYLPEVEEGMAKLRQMSLVCHQKDRYRVLPLTREFALSELAGNPNFESASRERWINWYFNFSEKYGGRDLKDWGSRFDRIDHEWRNFLAILEWCEQHSRYDTLTRLWNNLNCFASLRGYWGERCHWLDILIVLSKQRGAWRDAANAMSEKSYTLILMGQVKEAEKQLKEAWEICPSDDFLHQTFLAQHMAILAIQGKQYHDASKWLDRETGLLKKADFEELSRERRCIAIMGLRAHVAYHMQEYEYSRKLYEQVEDRSQVIGWVRKANTAHHGLANISIEAGDFEKAEDLLRKGLCEAEANNHKRLIAYYNASWARLEYRRKNKVKSCEWAKKALETFKLLSMKQDAEEFNELNTLYCPSA